MQKNTTQLPSKQLLHTFAWDDLRFFLAVAETGSLTAASKVLAVNHSTVFRRIQILEQRLNMPLFHRSKDGYLLNDAGDICLDYAKVMAEQLEQLQLKLSGTSDTLKGNISITAVSAIAQEFLLPAIAQFQQRHPDITVELISSSQELDLRRGVADIALRATASPPEYLVGHKLMDVPWQVMAGQHFFESYAQPENWEQAKALPWIEINSTINNRARKWVNQQLFDVPYVLTCNDIELAAAAVAANVGLAYLPQSPHFAKHHLQPVKHLMHDSKIYYSQLWLLVHPELKGNARVMSFYRYIIKYFQ